MPFKFVYRFLFLIISNTVMNNFVYIVFLVCEVTNNFVHSISCMWSIPVGLIPTSGMGQTICTFRFAYILKQRTDAIW